MSSGLCPNNGRPCEKLQILADNAVDPDSPQSVRKAELSVLVEAHACIGNCALSDLDVEAFVEGSERAARRKGLLDIFVESGSPLLTEEEKSALLSREDRGINPIPMRQFEDLQAFKEGSNNFFLTFSRSIPEGYVQQRRRAVQRFTVLYPERVEALLPPQPFHQREQIDEEGWQRLYEAYQDVSQLVDIGDPSAIRNGEVDDYFLCR